MRQRSALGTLMVLAVVAAACASPAPVTPPPSSTLPQPSASIPPANPASPAPSAPPPAPTPSPIGSPGQGPAGVPVLDAKVTQDRHTPALFSVAFVTGSTGWAGGDGVILGTTG